MPLYLRPKFKTHYGAWVSADFPISRLDPAVKLLLPPAEQRFAADVETFIRRHWQPQLATAARLSRWQQALVEQGWSVPGWPQQHGGTGWSATRKYLWQRACIRHRVPLLPDPGATVVAPLLFDADNSTAAEWLDAIRTLRSRWCVGFLEAEAGAEAAQFVTQADVQANGSLELNGRKIGVRGAAQADWLCCLARVGEPLAAPCWLAVHLHSPGVSRDKDTVTLNGVQLPAEHLLAPAAAQHALEVLLCSEGRLLQQSAWLQGQLDMLLEVTAGLSEEPGLQRGLTELGVAVEALRVMELRYAHAVEQGGELPFPAQTLALRGEQIFTQLGDLQMQSFGYYALPYPDGLLSHNEMPIGSPGLAEAVQQAMMLKTGSMYEEFATTLTQVRDQLADRLKIN